MTDTPADAGNRVRVSLECAFRGENLTLSTLIDLDASLGETAEAPDFHAAIARAHDIDPYSYLYEVVESEEIRFSAATGLAADYCTDTHFDWNAFAQAARNAQALPALRAIAARDMGIDNLAAHPQLQSALLAAWHAGRQAG